MQKLKLEVVSFAEDLEGQIPAHLISAATKKKFKNRLHPNSVNNYLKDHPEYFNKAKARKPTRKQTIKGVIIKAVKSFKEDDPRLEQMVHHIMLSEKVAN